MKRQELIANLKNIRSSGTELKIKLTASTLELQSEYDRIIGLSSVQESKKEDCIGNDTSESFDVCIGNTCLVAELPVLPEDGCEWVESTLEIEEFRQLLDHSWESSTIVPESFNVYAFAKETVKRIAKLSRDWCMREAVGFMSLFHVPYSLSCWKMTTRTPRRVIRRAKKFIADICKASKGMIHAQYTRSF
jgi:hypothetical protein